jgi:hypothetical protein
MNARPRHPHSAARRLAAALALVVAAGCGGAPTPIQRVIDASKATADMFRTITDPATATAAIPKLQPTFKELGEANAGLLAMITDPGKAISLMSQARSSMEEMGRVQDDLKAQMARINKLKGLPAEFWNVARLEDAKMAQAMFASAPGAEELTGPLQQACNMYTQYSPQRVVDLKIDNDDELEEIDPVVARVAAAAGKDAQVVQVDDPMDHTTTIIVGPVEDFDKFLAGIDFAQVVDKEKAKGEAHLELDLAEFQTASTEEPSDAPPEAAADPAADPSAMPEAGGELVDQQQAAPPKDLKSRLGEMYGMLAAAAQAKQAAADAKAALGPQPADPDYHAQLASLLLKPDSPHHQRAVTALLEVKPADVADKKLRAQIAKNYRELAFGAGAHAAEAIDGLVLWGGKFSAPLLIELLEKQSGGDEAAIYNGLGQVATPEGAAAVVKRLESGGGSGGEAAFACLKQMGPVAESALVAALPFDSPESNRAAIEVLGQIGAKKSTAVLRKASKSENESVKNAALEALKAIQARQAAQRKAVPASS